MTVSEAQRRANDKYNKANTVVFTMRLNYKTDADIIKKLNEVDSRQGYIKQLIRQDIERSQ